MSENKSCCQVAGPAPPSDDRRLVVKILAGAVGAVATLFPVVAGLVTFADPATRRERRFRDPKNPTGGRTEDGFLRVASLSEVPADGTPLRVTITDDVTNKWTFSPGEPVGEVFLRKTKGNANEEQVTAWTTVCPHLGCSISLVRGEEGKPVFRCPCHNSSFELDGKMIAKDNPSPRDMDSLETRVVDGEVYVKYESFYTGRTEKQARH